MYRPTEFVDLYGISMETCVATLFRYSLSHWYVVGKIRGFSIDNGVALLKVLNGHTIVNIQAHNRPPYQLVTALMEVMSYKKDRPNVPNLVLWFNTEHQAYSLGD